MSWKMRGEINKGRKFTYQKERCLRKIGTEEPYGKRKERKKNMIDGVPSCILHPIEMNFDLSNSLLTQRGQWVEDSRN